MTDNTELTVFQQLVNNDEVPRMIHDLEEIPENNSEEVDEYELRISFTAEDVPAILGDLRELAEDDGDD